MSFILPCDEIGNDDCIARPLKIADTLLIALLKGNNLDLRSMIEKDELIKTNIKKKSLIE